MFSCSVSQLNGVKQKVNIITWMGYHVKWQKIPLGTKILKHLQNALTTKQGNTFIYCTHEKLHWKGNWRCGLWLRHTNAILPMWPVSPTAELIRPINNQRTAHFLPQPNKKLDQYWISSNPLILFSLSESALLLILSPVARQADECDHTDWSTAHERQHLRTYCCWVLNPTAETSNVFQNIFSIFKYRNNDDKHVEIKVRFSLLGEVEISCNALLRVVELLSGIQSLVRRHFTRVNAWLHAGLLVHI